jgi:hypothetical protein
MPGVKASRFFHTVVVLGAGVGTGCGARVQPGSATDSDTVPRVVPAEDGGVLSRADAFWPSRCQSEMQFRCTSYDPLEGCVCDSALPESAASCGGEAKLECRQLICEPGKNPCPMQNNVDCHCLPEAPTQPQDCAAGSGQFECSSYAPVYRTCRCNPDRPGVPTDCTPSDAFHCQSYAPAYYACACDNNLGTEAACVAMGCNYKCVSQAPRYGCQCECVIVIK